MKMTRSLRSDRRRVRGRQLALAAALGLLVAACTARRPPVVEPLRQLAVRTPVVVIPGITGTKLRRADGRVVWGDGRSFFLPRDGGYNAARSLVSPDNDELEAFAPVTSVRLLGGLLRVDIYASLIRLLRANGYTLGDLDQPRTGDDFFFFPYDWRTSSVEAARELADRLEHLRQSRGAEVLDVDLVCQSNAATIARYFVKYGGASLEEAAAGLGRPPVGIRVNKLIMIGTANGGALGTLKDLHRGRTYVPWIGRRFRPETLFTFPSLFEALPAKREDLFLDERGDSSGIDLWDARTWAEHQLSIFQPSVQRRLDRQGRDDLFGDEPTRVDYLERALHRARRLHDVLRRDVAGFGDTRYYSLQNAYLPTGQRALLVRRRGRWRLHLADDRRLRRDPLLVGLVRTAGDGHATLDSQEWVSPQERRALARPTVFISAPHRRIILQRAAHEHLLRILLE